MPVTAQSIHPKGTMHSVLFVDDEPNILSSVQRILRKAPYNVLTANAPEYALEILEQRPVTLVVSDFRMPSMDGVTFLEKVHHISPDSICMLLTGFADTESAIRAINNGHIFRYLKKPIKESELLEALRSGIRQYELVMENRRLMELIQKQNTELKKFNHELEQIVQERTREITQQKIELENLYHQLDNSFTEMIRAFMTVIEMKNPTIGGHSRRVAALSRKLAEFMGLPDKEVRDIEVAALLHDIGKITLPDKLIQKTEAQMSEHEIMLLRAHPEIGASILSDIQSLHMVSKIVEAHHERFDGKGFPKKLQGGNIPFGARLIAVINHFDHLISQENIDKSHRFEIAKQFLESQSGKWFDRRIVQSFIKFIKSTKKNGKFLKEKPVEFNELQPGMIISRDIFTRSGLLLLGRDQVLNSSLIKRLFQYHLIDPIQEQIHVYAQSMKNS